MKMRWMAIAVMALVGSACGGTVEEESTTQPPTEQLAPPCAVQCSPGWICCGANLCCIIV